MFKCELCAPDRIDEVPFAEERISSHIRLSPAYISALNTIGRKFEFAIGYQNECAVSVVMVEYGRNRIRKTSNLHVISIHREKAEEFWGFIFHKLHSRRISDALILSFGAEEYNIPPLKDLTKTSDRWEYIVKLDGYSLATLHPKNRNMVRKAEKAGVWFRKENTIEGYRHHVEMKSQSMQKRLSRGEDVSLPEMKDFECLLLKSGAATLYQALLDGEIVSSIMVLNSQSGGYLYSAGTSESGMKIGASNALLYHAISNSQVGNYFNLGGVTDEEPGLRRYKERFGGTARYLPTYNIRLSRSLLIRILSAMKLFLKSPAAFFNNYILSISRYEHFVTPVMSELEESFNGSISPVTSTDLEEIESHFPKIHSKIEKYGDAKGAYIYRQDKRIAHISWMINRDQERIDEERNILLKENEVEVTHCYTLPEFRGKGLYPRMIRFMISKAFLEGYSSLHMITSVTNKPSQRGMGKAGLVRSNRIYRIRYLKFIKIHPILVVRPHRALFNGAISLGYHRK